MNSLFLFDPLGDHNQPEKRRGEVAYKSDLFLPSAEYDSHCNDSEGHEVALFGVKLNSKDIESAVTDFQKDAMSDGMTPQSCTQHKRERTKISDLDSNSGLNLDKWLENVKSDMSTSKRKVEPGLDHLAALPCISKRKQVVLNRETRSRTKGGGWFNLPATEITEEMRNNLKIIQMRSALNPKQFYKKNDLKTLPKFFQIGTVQRSVLDYHQEKNTRKSTKSIVNELLENEAFTSYNKRKYNEVIQRSHKYGNRKSIKKLKNLKKK
ncbi:hypothetical protein KR018_011110 [Drosophila ironensis]|nr:hypothetical protein KR018_011110 [Drosophila ironensis]